jgi:hypothetical protein
MDSMQSLISFLDIELYALFFREQLDLLMVRTSVKPCCLIELRSQLNLLI